MSVYFNEQGNLATVSSTISGNWLEILGWPDNRLSLAIFEPGDDDLRDVTITTDDLVQALVKLGILAELKAPLLARR
jgi:hypothetical protein